MKQKVVSGFKVWKTAFVVFAFCLASVVPFYYGSRGSAQTTSTVGTALVAPMTGPAIGNITPHGQGRYFVDTLGNKLFETEVRDINLPADTMLGVFLNGNPIGQIRLTSMHNGLLRLTGAVAPTVAEGNTLAVKNAGTVILTGTFAPPPTPSPSPSWSPSPSPTRSPSPSPTFSPPPSPSPYPTPTAAFFAPLNGPTIEGIMPRGVANYAEFGTAKRLNVFVSHVRMPAGTVLNVLINGESVGNITLNNCGEGVLRLDSTTGANIPTVIAGSTAAIKKNDTTVLAGTFRAFICATTSPSPCPTVSPTPSPSVTPPPTPNPNRSFGGNMTGEAVVPPVTTLGRGVVNVLLNADETQIRVQLAFNRLSSAQTTAKIYGPAIAGETGPAVFDLGTVGGTAGGFNNKTFAVTAEQVAQLRNGLFYAQVASVDNPNGEIRGQIKSRTTPSNFLGAGTQDIAVYRPSNGTWYVMEGSGYSERVLGGAGDTPVSGDFDGDGMTDYAVFAAGNWSIRRSSDGGLTTRQFGLAGDVPARGDYDGDGQSDLAVFRPSNGTWYVEKSDGTGYTIIQFGLAGDIPVAADMDGDGMTDLTVFRPSTGTWYWMNTAKGSTGASQFGSNGDIPIAGDFDGDGTSDLAVYRPSTGVWYAWRSSDNSFDIRQFGLDGDVPVAGNYDNDGVTDIGVFRPSTGVWYIWRSLDNTYDIKYFGLGGDVPTTKN